MIVYRVENNESSGPYQNSLDWIHRFSLHNAPMRPQPGSEFETYELGNFKRGIHLSAFKDMKSLFRWFVKKERKELHSRGFKIALYEVHENCVLNGKKQVAFDHRFAKVINKISLSQSLNY